jgi:hypothetical protein
MLTLRPLRGCFARYDVARDDVPFTLRVLRGDDVPFTLRVLRGDAIRF